MLPIAMLIALAGVYACLLSTTNRRRLKQLNLTKKTQDTPFVSIAIPARNEEAIIELCVRSLMAQDYSNLEILILDDNSTDGTEQIVKQLQKEDNRVRYIKGKELKMGWKGKLYAMQQLFENCQGEFILFTDADTVHEKDSVQFGLNILQSNKAELLSGYPLQKSNNTLALTLISVMIFNTVLFLPLKFQEKKQKTGFAIAIGQYLFVRKSALVELGGFERIKNEICDDVMLARTFAKNGHKQMFADLKEQASCTMYSSFRDSFRGIERSITGVIKQSVPMFIGIVFLVLLLLVFVFSFPLAILLLVSVGSNPSFLLPAVLIFLGSGLLFGSWTWMALFHGYPLKVALQGPLAFLLVIAMYLHGYYCKVFGKGFMWKDRKIT
jgi:chlorobactene glucosyltransferase